MLFISSLQTSTRSLKVVSSITVLFEVGLTQGCPRLRGEGDKAGTQRQEATGTHPRSTSPTLLHAPQAICLAHIRHQVIQGGLSGRPDNLKPSQVRDHEATPVLAQRVQEGAGR